MAVCIEMLIPNGDSGRERERERGNPVIVRSDLFSTYFSPPALKKLLGSVYFFLFHYYLSRHRQDEGKSLKKKSREKRVKNKHISPKPKSRQKLYVLTHRISTTV